MTDRRAEQRWRFRLRFGQMTTTKDEQMTNARAGQHWEYTFRGVIDSDGALCVDTPFPVYISRTILAGGKGERLPDPEPNWQPGDLAAYFSENSPTIVYEHILPDSYGRPWYQIGDGKLLHDREVPRPLVPLAYDVALKHVSPSQRPDEPDWQPGDFAVRPGGNFVYRRIPPDKHGRVWRLLNGAGHHFHDDRVPRPLVRLVPEEKP